MNCPQDGTLLQMTAREGVEIDYCPKCRGVWLDRGELDKIIERSDNEYASNRGSEPRDTRREYDDDDDRHYQERRYDNDERRYDNREGGHHKKKKEGFLGDLFDF